MTQVKRQEELAPMALMGQSIGLSWKDSSSQLITPLKAPGPMPFAINAMTEIPSCRIKVLQNTKSISWTKRLLVPLVTTPMALQRIRTSLTSIRRSFFQMIKESFGLKIEGDLQEPAP